MLRVTITSNSHYSFTASIAKDHLSPFGIFSTSQSLSLSSHLVASHLLPLPLLLLCSLPNHRFTPLLFSCPPPLIVTYSIFYSSPVHHLSSSLLLLSFYFGLLVLPSSSTFILFLSRSLLSSYPYILVS